MSNFRMRFIFITISDCGRCVPCPLKRLRNLSGGISQDEICIMRKCELLTDDSDEVS